MFAKLTALASTLGGGYTFPYNVEEAYECSWGQWTHYKGKSKEDGSPVSIFKTTFTDANDKGLICARNGIKRLKLVSTLSGLWLHQHLSPLQQLAWAVAQTQLHGTCSSVWEQLVGRTYVVADCMWQSGYICMPLLLEVT